MRCVVLLQFLLNDIDNKVWDGTKHDCIGGITTNWVMCCNPMNFVSRLCKLNGSTRVYDKPDEMCFTCVQPYRFGVGSAMA